MAIYVTDGTLIGLQPRKYKLICEHKGYSWVETLEGTMKTYRTNQLTRVK